MANLLKKLAQVQLGSSDGAVFTVPGSTTYRVLKLLICNTHTSDVTFKLHHVSAAGSSTASNAFFFNAPLAVAQTIEVSDGSIFETAQMLRGLASTAAVVTVTVLGIEVT